MPHPHSNLVELIDNLSIAGNALATQTGVIGLSARVDIAKENGFRTLTQKGSITWIDAGSVGGPILVGFCSADFSLAEIEQKIEADPEGLSDKVAMEQVGRRLYFLGILSPFAAAAQNMLLVNTRHKVSFIEGEGMQYFIYNTSTNIACDAANNVQIFLKHLGVWLRD